MVTVYKCRKFIQKGDLMEKKVIITAALVGSRPTKEMNPAVPYTPEEIVKSAVECHKAGASIVHIHVRDPKTGVPDFKVELFKAVLDGIRSKCNLLVNLTTSALFLTGPDVIAQRLQPVYLKPDLGSFDLGSMNFQDRAFVNPPEFSEAATKCMKEVKVKPEIEVFDVGHIYQAIDLIQRGLIVDPPYFQLCMGVRWGIDATPENLIFMKDKLPPKAVWSVLGVGRHQFPMITMAMLLGGHARVGFEDNLYIKQGVLAKSNAQMVETAADWAVRLGREVATPDEARRILGI
jgi:3-keto-5-aminohexanoate cleavage enzyme